MYVSPGSDVWIKDVLKRKLLIAFFGGGGGGGGAMRADLIASAAS